jgi:hypothetical protein
MAPAVTLQPCNPATKEYVFPVSESGHSLEKHTPFPFSEDDQKIILTLVSRLLEDPVAREQVYMTEQVTMGKIRNLREDIYRYLADISND